MKRTRIKGHVFEIDVFCLVFSDSRIPRFQESETHKILIFRLFSQIPGIQTRKGSFLGKFCFFPSFTRNQLFISLSLKTLSLGLTTRYSISSGHLLSNDVLSRTFNLFYCKKAKDFAETTNLSAVCAKAHLEAGQ